MSSISGGDAVAALDLLAPDPTPMATPMLNEGIGPFSFDSGPSVKPPTIPMSAKLTFLAAIRYKRGISKRNRTFRI